MTTITKERAEIKSFITGFLSDPAHDKQSSNSLLANVFRIALASLEAEPVAYIFKHPAGKLFWALTDESNKEQSDVIPVYAAPPVPVVPEEKPMPNPLKMYAVDAVAAIAEVRGWNACRAAMLQGSQHVSQTYNLPELIEGMEVSIDVSTCDADLGNRYFGTVTEALELDTAKNGYILLVQDAEPNFDINGNSPVTPDGWVMVPKELTPEMMRAVQIRSELGGYATSNLSGAYNMFSEFWNVAVSAAPKVDDL
ncbi:TPA: hypothetical protein OGP63_000062 [Escherichia coli]|nr:hypothetical protein [Escherichia coli]